jgi:hypothetical protein
MTLITSGTSLLPQSKTAPDSARIWKDGLHGNRERISLIQQTSLPPVHFASGGAFSLDRVGEHVRLFQQPVTTAPNRCSKWVICIWITSSLPLSPLAAGRYEMNTSDHLKTAAAFPLYTGVTTSRNTSASLTPPTASTMADDTVAQIIVNSLYNAGVRTVFGV